MTQREDHLSYLQARAAAIAAMRDAAARLDAAPAYLRPAPDRVFADPGMAQSAADLADAARRASAARAALPVLDADFDRTEVGTEDPAASAREEQAALTWLNGVVDAPQLIAELVPDPRRSFLVPADPDFTPAKAQAIIDARAAQGGPFVSLGQAQAAAGLNSSDLADLLHTGRAIDERTVAGQSVGVLLPLRIETRFSPPTVDRPTWQLRLRVYPEAASIDRHAGPPTQSEWDHTLAMWQAADGDLNTPAGKLAFQTLAEQHQGARAAWLARTLVPYRDQTDGPITIPVVPTRTAGDPQFHRPVGMPDRLEVWLGRAGAAPTMVAELVVMVDQIALEVGLDGWGDGNALPATWWLSYQRAVDLGLGKVIDLGATADDIDVLYVIGLGNAAPDQLFMAHRAAGALAVVPPGTPTNTVAGAPAADLGRDPDSWRRIANEAGLDQPAPRDLEVALTGGAAALAALPGGEVDVRAPAEALVGGLWPVLWGRAFKDFLGLGRGSWELEWWAGRCLAPEGPYPTIRIGDQPYGILPVSSLQRWRHQHVAPAVEKRMIEPLKMLLNRWVEAGNSAGTVVGADTLQFLDVLSRTPTHRWGWQLVLPEGVLELWALTNAQPSAVAGLRQYFDRDVLRELEATFGLHPSNRYYGLGPPQPIDPAILRSTDPRAMLGAASGWPSSCPPIKRMLDAEQHDEAMLYRFPDPFWWGPQGHQEDGDPVQFLARLVRHALLLTRTEVLRIRRDPKAPAELHLPTNGADEVFQITPIPNEAVLETVAASGPTGASAARAFWTTRESITEMCALPAVRLDQALLSTLEVAGSRLDPWITGLATRRLRSLAARHTQFRLGAYSWVDSPRPFELRQPGTSVAPAGPTPAGLLHAPSPVQALMAAMLRDLGLRDPADQRWALTLDSQSIRAAVRLAADVQAGTHLKEALGREVERIAGDPALVLKLREVYFMRPEHAQRQVCDGEKAVAGAVAGTLPAELAPMTADIAALRTVLETYGDLLVADAAFMLASGRGEQAAEAMEASAGLGPPPSLRALRTERGGRGVTTTVLAILPSAQAAPDASPADVADPAFAAFLETTLGPAAQWTWQVHGAEITLAQLGLAPIDTLVEPERALEDTVRRLAGADVAEPIAGGTGPQRIHEAERLAALISGEASLPDFLVADAPAALAELGARLDQLTAAAQTLVDRLKGVDAHAALADVGRWGIVPDADAVDDDQRAQEAADLLDHRLAAARQAAGALVPPVADPLAARQLIGDIRAALRALVGGAARLPVLWMLPAASLDGLVAVPSAGDLRPAIDSTWLEVLAAVRPSLARVDAHQLQMVPPWSAWSTHGSDPWCTAAAEPAPPLEGIAHQVRVAYGPAGTLDAGGIDAVGTVAVALLDHWSETIPSRQHTTGAAFGFNAPKSRAPQAILVAVPPDLDTPLDTPTLIDILAEARMLARARMATPETLAGVGVSIPLPLLLADRSTNFVHTGTDLERVTP